MDTRGGILAALAALSMLAAAPALAVCPSGLKPMRTAEFVFGRNIGEKPGVSDDDWQAFLDREVATRFPNGFTVFDARGQWRNIEGETVREPSKILLIALTGDAHEDERLAGLARAYKLQFHQQSVLLMEEGACVTF
ncbi:MAG: DUF3574 domain-containing protein [Caulobacteraceae bacterium]|nr:DUF3574 domain-containing protein [Caulobacteraceae bacterium]